MMMKRCLVLLIVFAAVIVAAYDVPMHPDLKKRLIEEGRDAAKERKLTAPEFLRDPGTGQLLMTPDSMRVKSAPDVSGEQKILAILVDFSDNVHNETKTSIEERLFSLGVLDPGSFREYYRDASQGIFDVSGDMPMDWVRVSGGTYAYYVNGDHGWGDYPQNTQGLARDLVYQLDSQIDYSQYDNDGDGMLDYLVIIFAGAGSEESQNPDKIWSHKWSTFDWSDNNSNGVVENDEMSYITLDGVKIYNYCVQPEVWESGAPRGIGVLCHEFGHMLGLPDLYDIDGSSEGIGNYGLMAGGAWGGGDPYDDNRPVYMSAWCRDQLGWADIDKISRDTAGSLITGCQDTGYVARIWTEGDYSGYEYFLAEYRKAEKWDRDLTCHGLAIYHVDDAMGSNSDETHYLVGLQQADGLFDLENNNGRGDDGDLYPGSTVNREFSQDTTPSSDDYSGMPTDAAIKNISDAGIYITADLKVGITDISVSTGIINRPNPFNESTILGYHADGAAHVKITIFDSRGRKIRVFADRYLLSGGDYGTTWDGRDSKGNKVSSGIYYALVEIDGKRMTKKMVLVR